MMLDDFIRIVENNSVRIENGTLFCDDWEVSDKEILQYLIDNDCFEQSIYLDEIKIGSSINFELSTSKLRNIGFYDTCENFIAKNKFEQPDEPYYIYEKIDSDGFIEQYKAVQRFIKSIQSIAKHTFQEAGALDLVVSNEKQSVVFNCDYSYEDVINLDDKNLKQLSTISDTLCENNFEKKNLIINEIIDFVSKYATQLSVVLGNIEELSANCENAYQFYISGYSSNKFKFEINTKAIEYTSRIQTVINEAQTKLIAIPSAFVLAALAMEFDEFRLLLNVKNVVTVSSLFVFAVLIQLFISNQKNILRIIKADVDDYKSAFDKTKIELLSQKFSCVDDSLKKQQTRLCTITTLLWTIPSLLCLYLILSQFM